MSLSIIPIMSGFLVIPSALVQASGLDALDLTEHHLFWKLVGLVGKGLDVAQGDQGVTLRVPVSELLEPGERDAFRLAQRLEKLQAITFRANLDGRDNAALWRIAMAFLPEYELKDGYATVFMGPRMFAAITSREAFVRVREAALFAMRNSKYSSRLYVLIRDKLNQRNAEWEVEVPYFREVMQIPEGAYPVFKDLRVRVLEPAVAEVNATSELNVAWEKGKTHRNQVRSLVFRWSVKGGEKMRGAAKEVGRHKAARGKVQTGADAPPLLISAERWLCDQDAPTRARWAKRAVELGCPSLPAMPAVENVLRWASWVSGEILAEGLIRQG